jgi:hypothetical protein
MPRIPVLPLTLCLLLACCASAERVAQNNNERCVNRGLQPNTKEFEDCLGRVETDRQIRMDDRRMEQMTKSANPFHDTH